MRNLSIEAVPVSKKMAATKRRGRAPSGYTRRRLVKNIFDLSSFDVGGKLTFLSKVEVNLFPVSGFGQREKPLEKSLLLGLPYPKPIYYLYQLSFEGEPGLGSATDLLKAMVEKTKPIPEESAFQHSIPSYAGVGNHCPRRAQWLSSLGASESERKSKTSQGRDRGCQRRGSVANL